MASPSTLPERVFLKINYLAWQSLESVRAGNRQMKYLGGEASTHVFAKGDFRGASSENLAPCSPSPPRAPSTLLLSMTRSSARCSPSPGPWDLSPTHEWGLCEFQLWARSLQEILGLAGSHPGVTWVSGDLNLDPLDPRAWAISQCPGGHLDAWRGR